MVITKENQQICLNQNIICWHVLLKESGRNSIPVAIILLWRDAVCVNTLSDLFLTVQNR